MNNEPNKKNKVILTVLFSIVAFLNIIFILSFLFFMGFFVGKVESAKIFIDGMKIGQEKGRYEVYLELERREIGYYRIDSDSFEFKENKNGDDDTLREIE